MPWQPPAADVTPGEIRKERSQRASRIFQNLKLLRDILDKHEATIQKRWKKKTKEQKRKVITAAWKDDDLPKMHRPDFEAFRRQVDSQGKAGKIQRESFMWPFLNQEDLLKPRSLLLLLNSRGRNSPAEFAAADIEAIHLGIVSFAIKPAFLNEHVMLFTGRNTAETYGQLISWDDHPDAFDWLMTRKHMQPGEGLLILESQDKTMEFLVKCAKTILHDVDEEALLHSAPQPEPPASELETGETISWTLLAAEAPYRLPSRLSFARLESLLKAKRDAVEDHLWSLREDPAYFSGVLKDAWDHTQDHIKDRYGQPHPLFRFGREDLLWGRVITIIHLEHWTEFHKQMSRLKVLQEKYEAQIKTDRDLPEEYLNAILGFRSLLNRFKQGPLGQLKCSLTASPACRHHFVREAHDDPRRMENVSSLKNQHLLDPLEFEFFWLFQVLWEDSDKLYQLRFTNVLDELQRKIDSEQQVKDLISPFVAAGISDLAIIAECMRQLESYQPWANMFEDQAGSESVLARYGSPADNRFHYPIFKKRTRESVEAVRQAEQNLDAFWLKVDELLHRNARDLKGTVIGDLLRQPRGLQRTPEWVEPNTSGADKDKKVEMLIKPLSEVYFDLEHRTEQTTDKSSVSRSSKTKTKTRGQPAPVSVPDATLVEVATPPDAQPVFRVDTRALKVFHALFYTPSATSTPGEVKWDDFLWAMTSTKFKPEKLYGSVWQFTPAGLDVETPIQFHEPHGSMSGKIPFYVARRHGRRLNRNYGWHGGMFALAEKKTATGATS
ncbi:hypothetical protein M409DRAFT_68229 [Zasmidium cellare ATCC 36951]|uniref:Uncharacterized protein n=1 Tax=Zasmidium cellare ATCC 36951 TaxID=1080233 RepID=A0A6A6CCV2_ZASCE|nr:uncharacterized protein M409DRAFT_68229 [Zasmidium cellare ATCC 36951]KAF2164008.1 hypothetical protein M409DRAFT_68229 [Zasmidium cellare ATCC 36951]